MRSFFIALLVMLAYSSVSVNATEIGLDDIFLIKEKIIIHIGKSSRNYEKPIEAGPGFDIRDILRTDSPNFIAVSKKGEKYLSNELVIVWAKNLPDRDKDGLPDKMEALIGTDPSKKDSDSDGIPDPEEYVIWGENSGKDWDGDGIPNIIDPCSLGSEILDGENDNIRRVAVITDLGIFGDCCPVVPEVEETEENPSEKKEHNEVTLTWDANTGDVACYHVFRRGEREKYNYKKPAWRGRGTRCVIDVPADGRLYYFVVKAFDSLGQGSGPSNETEFRSEKKKPKETRNGKEVETQD